jgi:hypothetical protein
MFALCFPSPLLGAFHHHRRRRCVPSFSYRLVLRLMNTPLAYDFFIDASHELAMFAWNEGRGTRLSARPSFICAKYEERCALYAAPHTDCVSMPYTIYTGHTARWWHKRCRKPPVVRQMCDYMKNHKSYLLILIFWLTLFRMKPSIWIG